MKYLIRVVAVSLGLLVMSSGAYAIVDNDAQIIHLRKNCTENGTEVANCLTTSAEVMTWIEQSRTSTGPLTVQVGPGRHGFFRCVGLNNLSIKGSGPGQSFFSGLHPSNCFDLNVQDLTITDWFPAPIYWSGDGSSVWTNVHVKGGIYAWTETGCSKITKRPVHKWFSSQLWSKSKTVYLASCSENWIFGSELVLKGPGQSGILTGMIVRAANGENTFPEVHLYGGNLRVIADTTGGTSTVTSLTGVYAANNGRVHIHGTGIDTIGNGDSNDIVALRALPGGMIHAAQSAFVMNTKGTGDIIRIKNQGGTIMAPYLWEAQVLALGNKFKSQDGSDRTTEVACDATTSVCKPRSLIYMSSCASNGPWYDIAANACRK
ncbi:hypothetical protein MNBD_GAMMA12-3929 [hydrothermal vent metagenome]|uniref:Uncharacterized protein n=1 Tax=hydrothermal vent metagenome TaxID=652676 RepID=A0A3B0YQ26_9ZZZZ